MALVEVVKCSQSIKDTLDEVTIPIENTENSRCMSARLGRANISSSMFESGISKYAESMLSPCTDFIFQSMIRIMLIKIIVGWWANG